MRSGRAPLSQVSSQEVAADFLSLNDECFIFPGPYTSPSRPIHTSNVTSYLGEAERGSFSMDHRLGSLALSLLILCYQGWFQSGDLGGRGENLWVSAAPMILGPFSVLTSVSPSVGKPCIPTLHVPLSNTSLLDSQRVQVREKQGREARNGPPSA